MSEFRGALGSNTGDDFHELWATRQAIRLLLNEDGLSALTVEGLGAADEPGVPIETWDGVDCALYYGEPSATAARRIRLEQLKYSAAAPTGKWTVARLAEGPRRDRSVLGRLARAWKALKDKRQDANAPEVVLVSNQDASAELRSAMARSASGLVVVPARKPSAAASDEAKLAYASGLNADDYRLFAASLTFETGAGSRFALEERVLKAIAEWTDNDVQRVVTGLRKFVRDRMRPEFAGELITRESLILHLGASDLGTLLPCPPKLVKIDRPINRQPIRDAATAVVDGEQYVCLHGGGGIGKTTALQELAATLPANSIMVTYDCYGGGRYLDPSAYRHRSVDAFLQLTNELASRLALPLLLGRHHGSDFPRLFANRLAHAAGALAAFDSQALVVIAIDAADNAVTAAAGRQPPEGSFVHDFVLLGDLPANVRFIVTARTGRLPELRLPATYKKIEIEPFLPDETAAYVRQTWDAPQSWIDDFHHLSRGIPRVQAYALQDGGEAPVERIQRLRPTGKSLDEVFRHLFREALAKTGSQAELSRLCAGLIALARPIPLGDLAAVLESSEAHLRDICADLAPGIRIDNDLVSFADEDFEHFVREEGEPELAVVTQKAATWLLGRADTDAYAALNVAPALLAAGKGQELLDLTEREPAPKAILDPVQRREAEVQRLQLAIKVCRDANDLGRAVRFVLIGAEGVKTEAALLDLLSSNPDLAVRFAAKTVGRLVFSNPSLLAEQGPMLFHKLSADAELKDAISVREGQRLLEAWLSERSHRRRDDESSYHDPWPVNVDDIASAADALLRLQGAGAALKYVRRWRPRALQQEIAFVLAPRLIAEGRSSEVEAVANHRSVSPARGLPLLIYLAISGQKIDDVRLVEGLDVFARANLKLDRYFDRYSDEPKLEARSLSSIVAACEYLTAKQSADATVGKILQKFLLPEFRRIDRRQTHDGDKLDILLRVFCLTEARAGRKPTLKTFFTPRPEPADEATRRRMRRSSDSHDREIEELVGAVIGVYAATSEILVGTCPPSEGAARFKSAQERLEREKWRLDRQHGAQALQSCAARSAMIAVVAGCSAPELAEPLTAIHGHWGRGGQTPATDFVAHLALRPELHGQVLADLAAAAEKTRALRIGADDKSKTLVGFARLIRPISSSDANAVFNDAIEAASELDNEILAQLKLCDRLVIRGVDEVGNKREVARRLTNIVADAAIRLEGYDGFPWSNSMSALARLDLGLALGNAARWCDNDIARLGSTLHEVIEVGLDLGTLLPAQAAALGLLLRHRDDIAAKALDCAADESVHVLAEELSRDFLVSGGHPSNALKERLGQVAKPGPMVDALLRQTHFLDALPTPEPRPDRYVPRPSSQNKQDPLAAHVWTRQMLVEPAALAEAIDTLLSAGRAAEVYHSGSSILASALAAVAPRDRLAHVIALAGLQTDELHDDGVGALIAAIEAWSSTPAIQSWRRTHLADVIVERFPQFARYHQHGQGHLARAIALNEAPAEAVPDLILRGLQRHVDALSADLIFALLGTVTDALAPASAAMLLDWYATRLEARIPTSDRDLKAPDADLPGTTNEAAARVIFAFLGDFDVRMRWRAAHAIRRLARLHDRATLEAIVARYDRKADGVFRDPELPFYWLAARLWHSIAWDRVSGEVPEAAAGVAGKLLQIATDEEFPHVLVRDFARDACEKLIAAGVFSPSPEDLARLSTVNISALPKLPQDRNIRRFFEHSDEGRRFNFDTMDSLPYWYRPVLEVFASVDGDTLMETAEKFILDRWGQSGNIRAYNDEPRRGRLGDRDWSLSSNRHGARPVLERLNNHLEWHAVWCSLGELLKTKALVQHDDEDPYDNLAALIRRNKLTEPPLWLADLRTGTPLVERYWALDTAPLEPWVDQVDEARHREEVLPAERPDYVVVSADLGVRSDDRYDRVTISSALVVPETGGALLRALQTMDRAWDYRLPSEDEDSCEIDAGPYRLTGWLSEDRGDSALDQSDGFRGNAETLSARPGNRVITERNLARTGSGPIAWHDPDQAEPMFLYEVWGTPETDDERYGSSSLAAGRRLLAHKAQLLAYLKERSLDLLVEVEVQRSGREGRRYSGEEDAPNPEAQYDRLYKLGGDGDLSIAEGRLGAWTDNC